MVYDRRAGSNWPVTVLVGFVLAFALGLTNTGHQLCGEVLSAVAPSHRPMDPGPPARPLVLVVTTSPDTQARVAATVNPRGYRVLVAETAGSAENGLRSDGERVGVIVIDTTVADAGEVACLARSLLPSVHLVRLKPNDGVTDLALLLLNAI